MKTKLIGDRAFYRRVLSVMLPILLQNVITTFVNLLDNVMVGRIGTEPMSGVAIVNQLLFVFNLCIFGGHAGAGIFTAQFFGKNDHDGVRHTFRFKWFISVAVVLIAEAVLMLRGDRLISSFLHDGQENLDLAATLDYARAYLRVMLLQIPLFAVSQIYAGTLRETGETALPMRAGIIAVCVNLFFNYVLIFGKLGAPQLGVVGAAVATVISRAVELGIIVVWTHLHSNRCPFIKGAYRSFTVPWALVRQITVLGMPLLLNELLWSAGMTMMNQCFSTRGLEVVSAVNISSTVGNLFFCGTMAMGNTVAILVGQLLGAGDAERAVDEDRKLIVFSVCLSLVIGVLLFLLSPLLPSVYNTTPAVRALATKLLIVTAALMPLEAFTNAAYFTLRSGGKTLITFLFDCAFVWVLCIPLAFVLSRFTEMPILPLYIAVKSLELVKCLLGFFLVRSRRWVNNLVA